MKTQEFIDSDVVDTSSADAARAKVITSQGRAEIDVRVEQARQQMQELRRQQDILERERQELEELRRREEDFEAGKAEMLEELSRMTALIEHDEFELNKRATLLVSFREIYQDYVRQLNDIQESDWTGDELKTQLSKAAAVVESARAELNKGRAQLNIEGGGVLKLPSDSNSPRFGDMPSAQGFNFWLEVQKGLARNLPLIAAAVVLFFLFLMTRK